MKHRERKQREMEMDRLSYTVPGGEGDEKELRSRLEQALNLLPEKCRMVFQLSRYESLKYGEIAQRLGISVKTVEAHMGKALKTLRIELAEFLPVVLFYLHVITDILP